MADRDTVDEFLSSLQPGEGEAKTYRKYVERRFMRWLLSADALDKGRRDGNSSEPIRRMENAELNDYGLLETGIGLLRESIGARRA